MLNIDRALAYAKQRGVDTRYITNRVYLMDKTEVTTALANMGRKYPTKTTKAILHTELIVQLILPSLTPAQRHRIHQKTHAHATLRRRKERKLAASFQRKMRRV